MLKILTENLKQCFSEKNKIFSEIGCYKYILERSYNTESMKLFSRRIFGRYFEQNEDIKSAFEREFSYKKGIVNYFDPDFSNYYWFYIYIYY